MTYSFSRSFSGLFSSPFHRSALVLLMGVSVTLCLHAQESSSQAEPAAPQSAQPAAQTPAPQTANQASLSVQGRIRARREQRRATAIHDVYTHLYEVYVGAGYLRTTPGPSLQRVNEYSWDVGFTRYFNEKLGVTIDGRGNYGSPFVGLPVPTSGALTNPAISQYDAMIGPNYRLILHPRYSVSARVLGGYAYGNFSGDLGSFTPKEVGLYSSGGTYVINGGLPVEYNVSPQVGLRFTPEYQLTGFGSDHQTGFGFTAGLVVRWGKQ